MAAIQVRVDQVKASDALLGYLQRLRHFTCTAADYGYELSARGSLALLRCAKTWALIRDRGAGLPEIYSW